MRRKEDRFPFVFQTLNYRAHFHPPEWVKSTGRFVQNQEVRIINQRLREPNSLLHSFRISLQWPLASGFQFDKFQQLIDSLLCNCALDAKNFRVEAQNLLGGEKFV